MTDSDPGATFPTDGVRLEAVVDGRVAPEDLTPSEQRLLDLANAVRSQASTKELAGLGDALIVFAAQHRDEADPGATWSRSRRSLGRMRSAGAVAAVVVVLSAGAAAAATTGDLPTPLQHIAHSTLGAPEPGRHAHAHHSGKAHESKHHSAKPETSTHPSATVTPTPSKSVPSATPSSSPRSSGDKTAVGAGIAAHHHHHVTRTHHSADPRRGVHSHPKTHHKHHRKHHQSGTSGSSQPTPKPSWSGSQSPRH